MGEKKRVKISLEREGRESVYSAWKSVCERKKKEERKGREEGMEEKENIKSFILQINSQ